MIFLALMLSFSATGLSDHLLKFSTNWSQKTHVLCLELLPTSSAERAALSSVLCGEQVKEASLKDDLRRSSLLHLFVVSGAHLVWLEHLLCFLGAPVWSRALMWVLFSLACGWQPPIVRALLGLMFEKIRLPISPRGRSDQSVLMTGLFTLSLFPSWSDSLSLALSWIAALALSLPLGRGWRGEVRRGFALWILMCPLLATWSSVQPLGVIANLFVAPLFSLTLVPLAVVCVVLPFTAPVFDCGFGLFRGFLQVFPEAIPLQEPLGTPSPIFFWAWIAILHIAIHVMLVRRRRAAR
jgi:competence protein ComEC